MLMKQKAFCIFCYLLYFNTNLTAIADDLQKRSQWTAVIKKVSNCNITGLKYFLDKFTLDYHYPKTYYSIRIRIPEDCKSRKIKFAVLIKRCNDHEYNCEDYQNWKFDNFCEMITWKNQIWSEVVDRIKPSFKCPFKKGIYEGRNASANVEGIMNWCPDVWKYHWKIVLKATDEDDHIHHCSIIEAAYQRNAVQDRNPSFRKPKHNSKNIH